MRIVFRSILALALATSAHAEDLVLVGGTIVDGSGDARYAGNVRIRGDGIAEIGTFQPDPGETTVDVSGMIVAPGFIDIHNHSADALVERADPLELLSQGITTAVLGPDGGGPIGVELFMAQFDENPPPLNILTFVGHATVRVRVMGANYKRAATSEEIGRMEELVEDAMREGAFGFSSALQYDPGFYATSEEIIALAKVAARYGGIYMTHLRNETDDAIEAVKEAIDVGRVADIPVQISHIKLASIGMWGKAPEVLALINAAREEGIDIAADAYPYNAWASSIRAIVPGREYGNREAVTHGIENVGGANNVLITGSLAHPEYNFRTLEEIARSRDITPADLYIEIVNEGDASIVCSSLNGADVMAFLSDPWVLVASDAGIGMKHPGATGTFPRVLGKVVRDDKVLTIETAVRKMTGLPASRLGLNTRGVLAEGAAADIVVFDPDEIQDLSTVEEPEILARGVKYVFVNGEIVLSDGQPTGVRAGLPLR